MDKSITIDNARYIFGGNPEQGVYESSADVVNLSNIDEIGPDALPLSKIGQLNISNVKKMEDKLFGKTQIEEKNMTDDEEKGENRTAEDESKDENNTTRDKSNADKSKAEQKTVQGEEKTKNNTTAIAGAVVAGVIIVGVLLVIGIKKRSTHSHT